MIEKILELLNKATAEDLRLILILIESYLRKKH